MHPSWIYSMEQHLSEDNLQFPKILIKYLACYSSNPNLIIRERRRVRTHVHIISPASKIFVTLLLIVSR